MTTQSTWQPVTFDVIDDGTPLTLNYDDTLAAVIETAICETSAN